MQVKKSLAIGLTDPRAPRLGGGAIAATVRLKPDTYGEAYRARASRHFAFLAVFIRV